MERENIQRNSNWENATPYGRETIQGKADRALVLPKEVLEQYKEIATAFADFAQTMLGAWPEVLRQSTLAETVWNKFGPTQQRLFWKSTIQILDGTPYVVRFDSTLGPNGKVAIFEPEIQNCGDGPLFQRINEYGRDQKISDRDLLTRMQNYLNKKGPVSVTRSKDNMTFYWPTVKTLALAISTSGAETIPAVLDDLEINEGGVFWTPNDTSEITSRLLTSPSWYKIRNEKTKINTIYNQIGTKAIFYPNRQEERLFQAYCTGKVDIFPTPNPLIASKAILALVWDDKIKEMFSRMTTFQGSTDTSIDVLRKYIPPSFIGADNCPTPNRILPAVVKPIFGAKQQGIRIIGLPQELEEAKRNSNLVIQKWVQPYDWQAKINGEEQSFKTRLESFCWIENGQGTPVDYLATGSTNNIVGGNRKGPMTTVYFK